MTTSAPFAADLALVACARANDDSAWHELVRRLLPRSQRLCLALLRSATDAKDSSQAAVLQILRSIHTYQGQCSLEHWSDRIVSRTALRWIAAERRTRPTDGQHAEPAVEDSPQPRIFARECLGLLPQVQRTTLVLRCCFDYSVEEIAELMGVSRNTVKDRLLRARRTVRTLTRGPEPAERDELVETMTLSAAYELPTQH
jgi:RNA polymerase sigma-70 factor, ECF subfamily